MRSVPLLPLPLLAILGLLILAGAGRAQAPVTLRGNAPLTLGAQPPLALQAQPPLALQAQAPRPLRGTVVDRLSRTPVAGAHVLIQETDSRTLTDSLGAFLLDVPRPGAYRVRATAPSYAPADWRSITIPETGAGPAIVLELEPRAYRVPTVEITGERIGAELPQPVTRSLIASEIRRAPGGFQDPLRALQESRAIESRNDLGTLLSIRGGEPDQVLFLMDGFDVYNPYRMRIVLGGGLSLANPDLVQSVELYAGGFSARYGNRTSGVIHLRTREGNRSSIRTRATLSLVAASAALEGPLPLRRGSWIVGLRRTYYDLVIHPPKGEGTQYPFLQEGQARLDLDLDGGQRVTVRAAVSDEGIDLISRGDVDEEEVHAEGGSTSASFSIEHDGYVLRKLRAHTRIALLGDRTSFDLTGQTFGSLYADARTRALRLTSSQEWEVSLPPHLPRIGFAWDRYESDVDWRSDTDTSPTVNPSPDSLEIDDTLVYKAFFVEDLLALRPGWFLSMGVRFEDATGSSPLQASPRFALRGTLPYAIGFRLGAGQFLQYPDGIQAFSREAPLFIEPLSGLPPEAAHLVSAGVEREMGRLGIDVEAYARDTADLAVPMDRETYTARAVGEARARGLEVELRWRAAAEEDAGFFRRLDLLLAHAWIDSRFRGGIYERWTPVSVERTHSFLARLRGPAPAALHFTAALRVASGAPYTPLLGRLALWDTSQEVYYQGIWADPFSAKTKPYVRLDLRLDRDIRLFGREAVFFVEVLNATARANTLSIQWDDDFTERRPVRGLPLLPFIGLSL